MSETKKCKVCENEFPLNTDYFRKSGKYWRSECRECESKKSLKYYAEHKEQQQFKHKKWLDNNKEHVKIYKKTYNQNNRIEIASYLKQWRDNHKEHISKYNKEYKKLNSEILKKYAHKYNNEYGKVLRSNIKYKEYKKIKEQERRAIKNKLIYTLTQNQWEECLKYFDYKDAYTGLSMNKPTQDHVIPVTKGGSYVKSNIVPCDFNINVSKNNRNMEQWYKQQPFYSEQRLNKIYEWIGVKSNIQQLSIL